MKQWLDGKKLLYLLLVGILILVFSFLLMVIYPHLKEFFSFLRRLFLPFFIAAFVAYLLFPIVAFLDRQQIHKGLAVFILYILFFGGTAFAIYRIYPQVIHQMNDLIENFPELIEMYDNLVDAIYNYTSFLPEAVHDRLDEFVESVESTLDQMLGRLVNGFLHLFDYIIILTVIPVLVFYFIKDFQLLTDFVKHFIPARFHMRIKRMAAAIDEGLGGYIRGQLFVCLFIALFTLIAFRLLGVPYALLLSILLGLTNLIPYFGPIIGAVPAVLIAYTTSPALVIYVILTILAVQILEGNFLSPYIVGKNIKTHPVAIIFVLLLGGELFGILGMILAVPVLTILKVIVRHLPHLLTEN